MPCGDLSLRNHLFGNIKKLHLILLIILIHVQVICTFTLVIVASCADTRRLFELSKSDPSIFMSSVPNIIRANQSILICFGICVSWLTRIYVLNVTAVLPKIKFDLITMFNCMFKILLLP